jgi:hypothetical protein
MLRDFAIDPDALASWGNCRAVLDRFVMGSGAMISEYPKRWRRMVYESAARQCRDMELKRITERLNALDRCLLIPGHREYPDNDQHWIDKALDAHQRQPFGGVICAEDAHARPESNVISVSDVQATHPLFAGLGQAHVARNPTDMAQAVRLLLADAIHVKFIDTHYRPGAQAGFDEPIRQILGQVRQDGERKLQVELHTESSDRRPPDDQLQNGFAKIVRGTIPNAEVTVIFYDQGCLHNRFLLTDKGGVMWGTGLDEQGSSDRKTETDDLFLLNDELYRLHWSKWNSTEAEGK